jgi:isopentenyl-diphosphate Delta-isomerase
MSDEWTRKTDHLELCISGDVGFRRTNLFEQVSLVHDSLPEVSLDHIDLTTKLAGKKCRTPLMIASMTGGNREAENVNRQLAEVAEAGGYAIGLGSQRPMVKNGRLDAEIGRSFQMRDLAPSVAIFGNLGAVQARATSTELVEEMVQFVGADGLFIHLNPAQEMIQPEGDRDFRGCLAAIERLVSELSVPVIVKETGCGLSASAARRMAAIGVRHVDVSGAGGTSWVAVETARAQGEKRSAGELFWDWGIPTAASLLQVKVGNFKTVIATGGISSGLDAARAVALGAHGVAMARPVLQALSKGKVPGALAHLQQVEHDLKVAMLLTGSPNLASLRKTKVRLGAELATYREEAD